MHLKPGISFLKNLKSDIQCAIDEQESLKEEDKEDVTIRVSQKDIENIENVIEEFKESEKRFENLYDHIAFIIRDNVFGEMKDISKDELINELKMVLKENIEKRRMNKNG